MFGILADIVSETVKNVAAIDKAVTDVYKETKKELGLDSKSIQDLIKGK